VRPAARAALAAGAALAVALAYPAAVERARAVWGVRAAGALVLAAGVASWLATHRRRALPMLATPIRVALLALPALAAASGAALWLRLVPAALQAALAAFFASTLQGGGSLYEDVARILEPWAPDFIGPYCRKATALFAALFALQSLALAALATAAPPERWARDGSLLVWAPLIALLAGEWLVRKAWFRHYGKSPIDRVLRRLLPPERTARGRRSLAYIERLQREGLLSR